MGSRKGMQLPTYQSYQCKYTMKWQPLRAFGYYGSKAKLSKEIADLLDYGSTVTYIEPFGGSASVLLNKVAHRNEIYCEKSIALCCFWQCMSNIDTAMELIERLYETSCDRETVNNFIREIDKVEASCKNLIDLSKKEIMNLAVACYMAHVCSRDNAGVRYATGSFNRGRFLANDGHHKQIGRLIEVADRFQGVQVIHCNAFEILNNEQYNSPEVLFYLDPPYLPEAVPGVLYRYNMTRNEHVALLERIKEMKCKILISGYDTDTNSLYDRYLIHGEGVDRQQNFRPWSKYAFPSVTTIARRTSRERAEVLWSNF